MVVSDSSLLNIWTPLWIFDLFFRTPSNCSQIFFIPPQPHDHPPTEVLIKTNPLSFVFKCLKSFNLQKYQVFKKSILQVIFDSIFVIFGLRGKFSSLGDSNHMHHLQLLSRHHDWAFCLWPTPVSGISKFFIIGIWFWGHMRAEFKHSSAGARTYNPSVDTRAWYPLCHLSCRQSVIESI